MTSPQATVRLIDPIPSDIRMYLDAIKTAHHRSLVAGLIGEYDACDKAKSELCALVIELVEWVGLSGRLACTGYGMGRVDRA